MNPPPPPQYVYLQEDVTSMRIQISVTKARLALGYWEFIFISTLWGWNCSFYVTFNDFVSFIGFYLFVFTFTSDTVYVCASNPVLETTDDVLYFKPSLAQKFKISAWYSNISQSFSVPFCGLFASTCFVMERPPSAHQTLIGLQLASTQWRRNDSSRLSADDRGCFL